MRAGLKNCNKVKGKFHWECVQKCTGHVMQHTGCRALMYQKLESGDKFCEEFPKINKKGNVLKK
jgi:hypothetical protein